MQTILYKIWMRYTFMQIIHNEQMCHLQPNPESPQTPVLGLQGNSPLNVGLQVAR